MGSKANTAMHKLTFYQHSTAVYRLSGLTSSTDIMSDC